MRKNHLLSQAVLASTLFITPLVQATVFQGTTNTPQATSGNGGVVEVAANGQIIVSGANTVTLDSPSGKVITDANNNFAPGGAFNAIQNTDGGAFHGVSIPSSGASGSVNIGINSGIHAMGAGANGILVNATNVSITNAGTVQSDQASAIELSGAGLGGTLLVNNNQSGLLTNTNAGGTPVILVGAVANGPLLTFNNSGIAQSLSGQDVINIGSQFSAITNNAGGIIAGQAGGNAINVGASGSINNNANALISAVGGGLGIVISSPTTGNIVNGGIVQTNFGDALQLNANVNSVINSGTLFSSNPSNSTLFVGANPVVIAGGIINSGNITNANLGQNAINLQTAGGTKATLTQNAGIINGNVLLADADSTGGRNVFFMNGGTVIGDVNASNVNANTLALTGGNISGNVNLGGVGDIVNLSGTSVLGLLNGSGAADTFNVTGGSFGLLDGSNGLDILNVNGTFFNNGPITNIEIINVNTPGTLFILNAPITNMNNVGVVGLTINAGTTMIDNAFISGSANALNNGSLVITGAQAIDLSQGPGTVTNNGFLRLTNSGNLNLKAASFTSNPNANVQFDIVNIGQFGNIVANVDGAGNVNFAKNSFISPKFQSFIAQGSLFDIVTDLGAAGTITDNSTLIQPTSAVVSFQKNTVGAPGNSILQLSAFRNTYSSLSSTSVTTGIAGALDILATGNGPTDPNLINLLYQLDSLPTQQAVEAAMESLAPPFNYGLVKGSRINMDNAFQIVDEQLDQKRKSIQGMSYGDYAPRGATWIRVLGAHLDQDEIDGVAGYEANAGGVALGLEWGNDCTILGVAASYTKVDVDDKNNNPKDQDIESWQATVYGWYALTNRFDIEAMIGAAWNDYDTNRVISVNQINTAAQASFEGTQFGAQLDLNWNGYNNNDYYATPFVRFKYSQLNLDNYSETGADFLNLTVSNNHVDEFLGGIGVKVGKVISTRKIEWVPELIALVAYDFENDGEQSIASFVNGPAFTTNGIKPDQWIFDLGLSLDGHICKKSFVRFKYDLELREEFVGNAAYVQYYYLWS